MKLCIPIADRPEGGMYTFLDNFRRWMDATGVQHTQDENDPAITAVLSNSWVVPYRRLAAIKRLRPHVVIAQRVDGVAQEYGRDAIADAVQARANLAADITIFQSEFSRLATTTRFRLISGNGPVIHNPVDIDRFDPDGPVERVDFPVTARITIACVSFSANPRKGNGRVATLATALPEANFVLCGNFPEMPPRPNVKQLGYVVRERLPNVLRGCDVFLMLAEHESCPNVVLEALASGLPVLYRDSGATPELVGECGVAIDETDFPGAVARLIAGLPAARAAARARAVSHFSSHAIFPRYLSAIAGTRPRPLTGILRRLQLALAGYPVFPGLRDARHAFAAVQARIAGAEGT
jgi:glycosyltransferase involved in cell wall biosynthesis